MTRILLALICACLSVSAFSQDKKPIGKTPKPKPIAATATDVPYGEHKMTVLDFWKADGDGPRPLLVYIHGGGW
ncbi:MAG: acetyl esterase/lipase, partial [Pseudoalteromonas tetraodonis]